MHVVMESYANIGDIDGTTNAMKRSRTMGFTPTSDTMNIILKSIVNSTDLNGWDLIMYCYSEHFGYHKFIADIDTYTELLRACEKYNRPDHAIDWFNELLSFGLPVTVDIKDTFCRILGSERYHAHVEQLHFQFRRVLNQVGKTIKPIPSSKRALSVLPVSSAETLIPLEVLEMKTVNDESANKEALYNKILITNVAAQAFPSGILQAPSLQQYEAQDSSVTEVVLTVKTFTEPQPTMTVKDPILLSSFPMRSLAAVRSMMDVSAPFKVAAPESSSSKVATPGSSSSKVATPGSSSSKVATAGSSSSKVAIAESSSGTVAIAGSSSSRIATELRSQCESFSRDGNTLGVENILLAAAAAGSMPGMVWRTTS